MPAVLALMDDLMFLSRVREAARGAGVELRAARDRAAVMAGLREGARLVLVDADSTRVPWAKTVASVRDDAPPSRVRIVAFVSHVHADLAAAARAAGCDRVLARSAFVRELPGLLAEAALPPSRPREDAP
jgi:CheY-like chemotaxis protein